MNKQLDTTVSFWFLASCDVSSESYSSRMMIFTLASDSLSVISMAVHMYGCTSHILMAADRKNAAERRRRDTMASSLSSASGSCSSSGARAVRVWRLWRDSTSLEASSTPETQGQLIAVTSHKRYCVSKYRQLDCLCNSLLRLTKKQKLYATDPLWRESTDEWWFPYEGHLCGNIIMTSEWARWRLKSPASRLFTQPFIHALIKENIKAPRHWPLCGEFTGDRWIPRTKDQ